MSISKKLLIKYKNMENQEKSTSEFETLEKNKEETLETFKQKYTPQLEKMTKELRKITGTEEEYDGISIYTDHGSISFETGYGQVEHTKFMKLPKEVIREKKKEGELTFSKEELADIKFNTGEKMLIPKPYGLYKIDQLINKVQRSEGDGKLLFISKYGKEMVVTERGCSTHTDQDHQGTVGKMSINLIEKIYAY